MNILIIHPKIIWRGAEQTLVNIALGLKKGGVKVRIVSLYIDKENQPPYHQDLDFILPSIFWQKMFYQHFFLFITFGFWVLLYLALKNSKKVDIINPHNFPSCWVAVIVGKIKKIPVIWIVHDIPKKISFSKTSSVGEYFALRLASGTLDKFFVKRINLILVGSRSMKYQVRERYGITAVLMYHPVSEIFFNEQNFTSLGLEQLRLQDKFVITNAANLHAIKNQISIIKAIPRIAFKIPQVLLVLAGEGPLKEKYEGFVSKNNLQDNIYFTGVISHERLSRIYSSTKVLVVSSLDEPWGMTPFEALLQGAVPVVSKYAGCANVIKENQLGIVIKPNPKEIARAVIFIKNNPNKVNKMVAAGQKWVNNNMLLPVFCQKLDELMHDVVARY